MPQKRMEILRESRDYRCQEYSVMKTGIAKSATWAASLGVGLISFWSDNDVSAAEASASMHVGATVVQDLRIRRINAKEITLRATGTASYTVVCGEREVEVARGVVSSLQRSSPTAFDQLLNLESYGPISTQGCTLNIIW